MVAGVPPPEEVDPSLPSSTKRAGHLTLLISVVLAVVAPATAAQAAGPIQIAKIYYDSPGSPDKGSNESLNGEYLVLKNHSTAAKTVSGWSVKDAAGYTYTLPTLTMGAGKTLTIRTGKGTNTSTVRYWNRTWYVWNNDKDTAYLRTSSGVVADSCSYNSTAYDYTTC